MATEAERKIITSSTGTNWVSGFTISPINALTVINNTGTTLEFRRLGDLNNPCQLPDKTFYTIEGINNGNEIQFRRADTSNTPVTAYGIYGLYN